MATFARYDALYRGGKTFRAMLGEFLPANPMEAPRVYDLRKREAAYTSHVGPIVDFFSAQLFASPFIVRASTAGESVDPDPFYATFREDVDEAGTDLVSYMKARFTSALVKGCSWCLAELPDDGEPAPTARADWDARGLGRARLIGLDACDVLDWECDDKGALSWAITFKSEKRRDDPRLARTLTTDTWKLYDVENVETFQVTYDAKKRRPKNEDVIASLGCGPHRFARVPLVPLRFPDGLWLLNRASDAQEEHFRLSAAESWAIKRTCYPQLIYKTSDDKDLPTTGPGYALRIGEKDTLEWVSPDTAAFESLAAKVKAKETELYRVANQMAHSVDNSAAALGRSGESKAADNASTEVCLHAYAALVRATIEDVYELVSDARGDTDVVFSIEGMDKFSLADVTTSLANIASAKALGIDSPTLAIELACKAADMLLPGASQPIKDSIRDEIQTAGTKPEPAPPAAPVTDETPEDASSKPTA